MLPINKNNTDNPLVEFCKRPDVAYSDIPHDLKTALNISLLKEQDFLCAYCMSRISEENMSIEHWDPRHPDTQGATLSAQEKEKYRQLEIDYKNMLAVCPGNEGRPPREQHCDTQKANKTLLYNPSCPSHYAKLRISYLITGEIKSEDTKFCKELDDVLNLNCEKLKNNRKAVISRVISELNRLSRNASRNKIQPILDNWRSTDSEGKKKEYAGVAIYFLEKRLSHAN